MASAAAAAACRRAMSSARSGLDGTVVIPIPGLMLTGELFSAARLGAALGARTVDVELGERVAFGAPTIHSAAARVVEGLRLRYGSDARAVLVGHSYGGYAALEVAHCWPERLAGLVLVSTQCRADTPGATRRRQGQADIMRRGGPDAMLNGLLPMLMAEPALQSSAHVDAVRSMAHSVGYDATARQINACASRSDRRETLRHLPREVPVLVVGGREDKVVPPRCLSEMRDLLEQREAAVAKESLPSAAGATAPSRTVTFADCGHLVPLERPDELHEALAAWASDVRGFHQREREKAASTASASTCTAADGSGRYAATGWGQPRLEEASLAV